MTEPDFLSPRNAQPPSQSAVQHSAGACLWQAIAILFLAGVCVLLAQAIRRSAATIRERQQREQARSNPETAQSCTQLDQALKRLWPHEGL